MARNPITSTIVVVTPKARNPVTVIVVVRMIVIRMNYDDRRGSHPYARSVAPATTMPMTSPPTPGIAAGRKEDEREDEHQRHDTCFHFRY